MKWQITKFRLYLFLAGCLLGPGLTARAESNLAGFAMENTQNTEFDCSMPIILAPLIQGIRNNAANDRRSTSGPQKCDTIRTVFEIGNFIPDERDESEYDNFIMITYQMPETTCKLYIKNNIVMKIEQANLTGKDNVYFQTIVSEVAELNFDDPSYLAMTQEAILKVFANECILLKLRQGVHKAVMDLTITDDVDVGTIKFTDENLEYRFCYYKGQMENAGFMFDNAGDKKLFFSMTVVKGNVVFANVYDDIVANGFDCGFYANRGLSFYLAMANEKFADVITWSLHGASTRTYPLEVWLKQGRPTN